MGVNMCSRKYRSDKGFTLVEVIIALTIATMLITATAIAFNASAVNFSENEKMFKAVSNARQALLRITSELRTATAVATGESSTQCSMITADGRDITYLYDADAQILYLVTNSDTTDADYVMCRNVTDLTFTRTTVPEDASAIRSVQVNITVTSDGTSQSLSAAAAIRRNLSW